MNRTVIIHFAPLELYPPAQNYLQLLDGKKSASDIVVISNKGAVDISFFSTARIKIKRPGKLRSGLILRYLNYCYFYLYSTCILLYYRPSTIIYFETISSLPAFLYKRLINTRVKIRIHYHEYTSPEEYKTGMRLVRFFHQLEKKLYPLTHSISHTNEMRMKMFKKDIFPIVISNDKIVPNYPPSSWSTNPRTSRSRPLKVIYVGAFGLHSMHTEKFSEWVLRCNGDVLWDIYSFNFTKKAERYILSLKSPWINIKGGVVYSELPNILRQYDVGVVLYNGHIANYIYNAPNKLFEYLACGLDVWFPEEMIGCYEFITKHSYPKVTCIDFRKLKPADLKSLMDRDEMNYQPSQFYCEPVYEKLYDEVFVD